MHGRVEVIFDNEIYKQFPFEIIRITPRYITLRLKEFSRNDKYEIKRLIEWFPPKGLPINVMSRFAQKEKKDRYYLTVYYKWLPSMKSLADLMEDNSITISFIYHCAYWKKHMPLGIKLRLDFNDKGLAKLFKHLL